MQDDSRSPFPPETPKHPYYLDANDRRLLKRLGIDPEQSEPDALPMNPPQFNPPRVDPDPGDCT